MADTRTHLYALALGSNRPLSARRHPARLLDEAVRLMSRHARVMAVAPAIVTPPVGPSIRNFVNSAMLVETPLAPPDLLRLIHRVEAALGRRRHRRWGARSMDIDIILWSGGRWNDRRLTIPHAAFPTRDFVLRPLCAIAPGWRLPGSGLSIRHLHARLQKERTRG